MTNSEYTVIIPFFNEEKTLETAVTNLINENFASEIILVNDGSVDKSNEIALRLENKYEYIKLIGSVHNKGKGHALNLGINESSKEYIGILDADLEYSPNDLKNLFEEIHENNIDIACGSRFIGDQKRKNLYIRTYLANKFLLSYYFMI